MPEYRGIKIELTEEEDAEIYYKKTCGKNKSVRKHAKILYYASKGTKSIKELCEEAECNYATANQILEKFSKTGVSAIYDCARGKRINHLDKISNELEAELDKNPPASVSEVVHMIKEKWNITITQTPVSNWLKKKDIVTLNQKRCREKQT